MIQSKTDFLYYLETDRLALGAERRWPEIYTNEIWKFERLLRKIEYFINCKNSPFWKPYIYFLKWRFQSISTKLGFSVGFNVFGPGLAIAHRGTLIVGSARIGANCRIHSCVNIGKQAGSQNKRPKIGNNVYIGPGAKIFGEIEIADNIAIGANAVVNKSFLEPGITIAGVPAKKISGKGSEGLLIKATELLHSQ
ncbi:MAG: serine acetyltransferase [Methanoregula sp.]|nr:serine acetyltransferase [Methanoregula sp.]